MKNLKVLQALQEILPAERFILGGSNAIKLHGISLPKEPEDLDIILECPSNSALNTLRTLQNAEPNPRFTGNASMSYSFYYRDVKVDVWINNELSSHKFLSYEGILILPIGEVIRWKEQFNRPKDWVQMMQWSKSIFDQKRFDNILLEIGNSNDYGNKDQREPVPVKDLLSNNDVWDDLPF